MKIASATLALVLFVASSGFVPEPTPMLRKCSRDVPVRFPDAVDYVYLMDGRRVTQEAIDRMDKSTIESLYVICHDELHSVFGVEAKLGGVVVTTVSGPSAALRTAMESLAKLQEAHHARTGSFATHPTQLGWSDATGLITVAVSVPRDGASWSAIGRHRYLIRGASYSVSGRKP